MTFFLGKFQWNWTISVISLDPEKFFGKLPNTPRFLGPEFSLTFPYKSAKKNPVEYYVPLEFFAQRVEVEIPVESTERTLNCVPYLAKNAHHHPRSGDVDGLRSDVR